MTRILLHLLMLAASRPAFFSAMLHEAHVCIEGRALICHQDVPCDTSMMPECITVTCSEGLTARLGVSVLSVIAGRSSISMPRRMCATHIIRIH